MTKMFRILLLAVLYFVPFQSAVAQSKPSIGGIPDEQLLNRYGLTLTWWGRSVIDGQRDTVLHITADEQNTYVQSTSGIITAFNGESGRQLWSSLVGDPDQRGFPATTNDEELLISSGMQIFSFDKNTGNLLWQLRSPEHPSSSPSLNEELLAIGSADGSVITFDIKKVRELHQERMLPRWSHLAQEWKFKTPLEIVSPPVLVGNSIVFASERGIVYGLSAKNKKFKFQFETDSTIHTPLGSSIDFVLVVDDDSRMFCLAKETGRIRWRFSSGAPIKIQPRVIGGQVFVIPNREGLSCLSLNSGILQWSQIRVTDFIAASETRVYATDISGNLLILNRETGELIGLIPLRQFTHRVANERTDRIYLSDESGLILGIRELDSEFPAFHLYPERRPILPELGADDEDAAGDASQPKAVDPFQSN